MMGTETVSPGTPQPARDLLREPLWQAADLGAPIPDSPDACSTALPLWAHAVGYEEKDPAVIDRLRAGYPRFQFHPVVAALMEDVNRRHGDADTVSYVFPSRGTAGECAAYVRAKTGGEGRIVDVGGGIHAVVATADAERACRAYWQHSGNIVSSRRARHALDGGGDVGTGDEEIARSLRARIGAPYGAGPGHVWLFPSGMAAIYRATRLAEKLAPAGRRVTVDFPYLDTLKVQQELVGPTDLVVPCGPGEAGWADCYRAIETGDPVSMIMTEVPSNPLLRTADIARLGELARERGGLLVIDDTIATPFNVDVTPWADLITVSLTKFFCGEGDVLAGALVVNPASPRADALCRLAAEAHEELLWGPDATVLEARSRDFEARVRRINGTAARLAEFLGAHPAMETLYYPTRDAGGGYEAIRRADGGHGGLMTILVKDAAERAPRVYDALRINKGPSLGTNYTLCCPYTILAHYGELDWAESLGVSRWLIRISVGLEDPGDLCARFAEAFAAAGVGD